MASNKSIDTMSNGPELWSTIYNPFSKAFGPENVIIACKAWANPDEGFIPNYTDDCADDIKNGTLTFGLPPEQLTVNSYLRARCIADRLGLAVRNFTLRGYEKFERPNSLPSWNWVWDPSTARTIPSRTTVVSRWNGV